MNESQIKGMRETWDRARGPRRPANGHEAAYVLGLARFAERIESDEVTLYWSEQGTCSEFSTQAPTYRIVHCGYVIMHGLTFKRAEEFAGYYQNVTIMPD